MAYFLSVVTICDEKGLSIEGISSAEKTHMSFSLLSFVTPLRFQPKQLCRLMGTKVLVWGAISRKALLPRDPNEYAWISKEQRKLEGTRSVYSYVFL